VSVFGGAKARAGKEVAAAQEKARSAGAESRVKGIFEDLLNLEINVIITPGMTARKMPSPSDALSNIAGAYDDLLREFTVEVQRKWKERRSPRTTVFGGAVKSRIERPPSHSMVDAGGKLISISTADLVTGPSDRSGFAAFDDLRVWSVEATAVACALIATPGWPDAAWLNEKVVLFKRVQRNCEQLQDILKDLPHVDPQRQKVQDDIKLTPEQLLTVRKVWDVGIATVVMQTVVQLDGDIVTRIQEGHDAASSQAIHALHRETVESAIKNWQFLGQTLAQFLTSALQRLL